MDDLGGGGLCSCLAGPHCISFAINQSPRNFIPKALDGWPREQNTCHLVHTRSMPAFGALKRVDASHHLLVWLLLHSIATYFGGKFQCMFQKYAQKPIETWCISTYKLGTPECIIRTQHQWRRAVETGVDRQKPRSDYKEFNKIYFVPWKDSNQSASNLALSCGF